MKQVRTFASLAVWCLAFAALGFAQVSGIHGSGSVNGSGAITVTGAPIIPPMLAFPTFSPGSGTYSSPQSVTLSDVTGGATICYTTDGSTPTGDGAGTCTHGTTFTVPVVVNVSETLMAIASKASFTDSAVGSAGYVVIIIAACAPPTYSCAYTNNDVVQTPAALFAITDAANTKKTEGILSQDVWSRLTDRTTAANFACPQNNGWSASPSGGSNDKITNTNTTMVVLGCQGGVQFVFGFNPTTMQIFPTGNFPSTGHCAGAVSFSTTNPNVMYCRSRANVATPIGTANGSTIYKLTYPNAAGTNLCGTGTGTCPDPSANPTWTVFFDFATCTQAPTLTKPLSGTLLSVGPGDTDFSTGLSWTGGQGTGRLAFHYRPGTGCATVDTIGDNTNMKFYAVGSSTPVNMPGSVAGPIHDIYTNGAYDAIALESCFGRGQNACGEPQLWQVYTANVNNPSPVLDGNSGHNSIGPTYFYNGKFKHTITSLGTVAILGDVGVGLDTHFSADVETDANPLIGTSDNPLNAVWTLPYRNEVLGWDVNSTTILRFGKTYESGNANNFNEQQAIGEVAQDHCTFFLPSDMLGTFGVLSGANVSDVFAIGICGQGH